MAQFTASSGSRSAGLKMHPAELMRDRLWSIISRAAPVILGVTLQVSFARAADAEPEPMSAKDLAARLSAVWQDGASYVRLLLNVKQPPDTTKIALQIQIKERRVKEGTDIIYQVLWPSERKGETVLLRASPGRPPSGALFVPPDKLRPLSSSQMNESLFGSDLSYEDVIENFYGWENQAILGTEVIDRVSCLMLESKPSRSDHSTYTSVRSWIDSRRLVPLRVEKYQSSGQLARRIDTIRVVTDDKGRSVPAGLTVRRPGGDAVTEVDGSRIRHDVKYADSEFTPDSLTHITTPRSTSD
jgi:hypothetical protein